MLRTLNIALGLTVPIACVVGLGIFMVTVFSVSGPIILGGFVVTGLIALAILAGLYFVIRRASPRAAPGPSDALAAAHLLLLAANVTAIIGLPLAAYDVVFSPPEAGLSPFPAVVVAAAVGICAVVGLTLLVVGNRKH